MVKVVGIDSFFWLLAMVVVLFYMTLLSDVFVGTASNIRGNKTIVFRERFKGVRVEGGQEMLLVRPIVGT